MSDKKEWEEIEEEIKIKKSELNEKYGMDILKARRRTQHRRSKKNTRKERKKR